MGNFVHLNIDSFQRVLHSWRIYKLIKGDIIKTHRGKLRIPMASAFWLGRENVVDLLVNLVEER